MQLQQRVPSVSTTIIDSNSLKQGPAWDQIVSAVLPQILPKVLTDKKFIANLAKKAVTACAENFVTPTTATCLIESVNAKSLDL